MHTVFVMICRARKGQDTAWETALLKIKDDMDMALDRGDGILLVLLDLSAAFDTLDHHILLDRLKRTCDLTDKVHQWLAPYLGVRTQQVEVGESLSKPKPLIMGVPCTRISFGTSIVCAE